MKINFEQIMHEGIVALNEDKLEDAEIHYRAALEIQPNHTGVNNNLGITLQKLGKLEEAEKFFRKAIEINSLYAPSYNNLGSICKKVGKLDEAEINYKKAIDLKPDYFDAYLNLGLIQQVLHKLYEAEINYKKAIALKPEQEIAYNYLGKLMRVFTDNGRWRLSEAETSFKKAIELKPNYTDAIKNLSILLRQNQLLKILEQKKSKSKIKKNFIKKIYTKFFDNNLRLSPNPFISYREVEPELLASLYKINSTKLDYRKVRDARYGNGSTNEDWQLFKNDLPILKTVENDLTNIIIQVVKSDIYIIDSFFNILSAGSGSLPHQHINTFDTTNNLTKKKYAFAYYLTEGDKQCSEPGIFKLYDPDKEILPTEGTVIIFPAGQKHSAVYNGKTDRVMIGINFYSLI